MSTPAPVRVSAGVPNGGQFAHSDQTEASVVLDGNAAVVLPPWGDELDAKIDIAVCDWVAQLEDGSSETDISELLGADEDELVAAYGEERSDFLCALKFEAENQDYQSCREGWDGPAEYGSSGYLEVSYQPWRSPTGKRLAKSKFSFEDEPEIRGLIAKFPVTLG